MKQLVLMRHAKSDWTDETSNDFDRTLTKRGQKAAALMGKKLKEFSICPDLILSSSAIRAKTTAEIFAEKNGYSKEIILNDDFYFGSGEDIITSIKSVQNNVNLLMIVGHNPIMEDLVAKITIDNQYAMFKTASIVILSVPVIKWSGLKREICDIEKQYNPSDFSD